MPPPDNSQPSPEQVALIGRWIDEVVFHHDCNNPDPGRVTIRRLNREEYNNTIRDLVGVRFRPADDFPADDSGYGFFDGLGLSPGSLMATSEVKCALSDDQEPLALMSPLFSSDAPRSSDDSDDEAGAVAHRHTVPPREARRNCTAARGLP